MRNIKLTIEYDGTNYCGWQRQKDRITIQQTLEKAISNLTKKDTEVIGCSRTDSGVHAKGFIANFFTDSSIPGKKFREAINVRLPEDIVILNSQEVCGEFHSRYNSKGKRYVYTIFNRRQRCAIYRNYMYAYSRELDLEKMNAACQYIIGKHDFTALKSQGSSVKTSTRTVTQLDIEKKGDVIKIITSADGFLYNMIRIIVGTLLDVGVGKIAPEQVGVILLNKDRSKAGKVVPASGLCLQEVFY